MVSLNIRLLIITIWICCSSAYAQRFGYFQQEVDYKISVVLQDSTKMLDGEAIINYKNNSPDTLRFIWFHCWPNAYKNDRTAFSEQLLENGRTDFYFSEESKRGYMNRLLFKADGITTTLEDHPVEQDIIKVLLPKPLLPGTATQLEASFHVKLPYNFSRGGYVGQSVQATQWYPKPAVYDQWGWNTMPYLDQGEFYSGFGQYDVKITLPSRYRVAATGMAISTDSANGIQTVHYIQDKVHDFAWFADPSFVVLHDTLQLPHKTVDVYAYYIPGEKKEHWLNSIRFIKDALLTKSRWIGEYPYPVATVVEHPSATGGGMEYPTITLIGDPGNSKELDLLINHEVGHNWFYGILASNERVHPWLDEGLNSYYDQRYLDLKYGNQNSLQQKTKGFMDKRIPEDQEALLLESVCRAKKDQPIFVPSQTFSSLNYGLIAYTKTAQWLQKVEKKAGTVAFDSMMRRYYDQWQFKHPNPADFKANAVYMFGSTADSFLTELGYKGSLQKTKRKGIKIQSFFGFKDTDKHNYLFVSPLIGYNTYDRFMLGGLLHNYTLPQNKFNFLLAPMYAFGSKEWNGFGRLSYQTFPGTHGNKLEIALAGAKFTADDFTDENNNKYVQPFTKIVPSITYSTTPANPRSSFGMRFQWKTFLITETDLSFSFDTISQSDKISLPENNRYLNQFTITAYQNRVLYPYNASLVAEQGKSFFRLALTANQLLNYPKGGGLALRFFAGKFFYTGAKTFSSAFETSRYHLNMSGPNGYEDYTYSNYFFGRNEFEGFASQQMMNRDGAFKVRTDLLSEKIGRSDDWLSTLNLSTTIPDKINPLSLLPIKIPLKIYADLGTYAAAWKDDATTGRFLYNAGLQISLIKNLVNIYFPLVYSKVYRDYFKSTVPDKRFLRNISFTIDIQQLTIRKFIPQSPFN
jgi:hypothetical protein